MTMAMKVREQARLALRGATVDDEPNSWLTTIASSSEVGAERFLTRDAYTIEASLAVNLPRA